jgi:hypothetical protein
MHTCALIKLNITLSASATQRSNQAQHTIVSISIADLRAKLYQHK